MRAAVVVRPGGPEAIEIVEVPVPEPGPGQVRVRVAGAAVNPVDLSTRAGIHHRMGRISGPVTGLGWDVAGTVDAVGAAVSFPVGERVAGMLDTFDRNHGTYAEYVVIDAAALARVPAQVPLTVAAAVPLAGITARAIADRLGAGGGRRLLVTGAAGAIGGYLVRLALDLGWEVSGLARTSDQTFVETQGAQLVTAPGQGWDAVADAAAIGTAALESVADGGVYVGVRPGRGAESSRGIVTSEVRATADGTVVQELLDRVGHGGLEVRVNVVLPLAKAADAHALAEQRGTRGRIILDPTRS
jgi:NADPH:quinone reductase-like Zn-dependent oxidoreductase